MDVSLSSMLSKQASIILAEKNLSLTKYVESVRKKHEEDEDYSKWDLSKPLPKLPVPELESSLKKYLRCLMPIVTEREYEKVEKLVEDLLKPSGEGYFLQKLLHEFSNEKDNWAYDWWLEDMYMNNKLPLPINSNPGMVFPKQNFKDEDTRLRFVARFISGIMDYKLIIDARSLPIDRCKCREKGQPLCMEQYYRLFSSYRIPGIDKDKLVESHTNLALEPEHVIVISRNQIFVLDVIVNFTRLSDDDLYHQLKRIIRQSEDEEKNYTTLNEIGVLTSLPRDQWAQARTELIRVSANRDSLDIIERCIFVLCLDKSVKSKNRNLILNGQNKNFSDDDDDDDEEYDDDYDETDDYSSDNCNGDGFNKKSRKSLEKNDEMNAGEEEISYQKLTSDPAYDAAIALNMLHGLGSRLNSGNRWFDKTMQFIITEDGACGLNYEHSPSEGIAVIELSEHLFRYMEEKRKQKLLRMPSICELPMPRKLKWKINNRVKNWIDHARVLIDKSILNLDMFILKYDKFGRDFPKNINISPDSFIQLSMQLAYYSLYGKLVSTYESASTRRFRKGRVDNIRANSCEALAWVKSMKNDLCSQKERFDLFSKALQYQTDLMIQNILGKGMDCHLLALKRISEANGLGTPDLFKDETYSISNKFALSTSQVPTSMDESFMCYGPVVPNGYGCSYNPKPSYIIFVISSFKSCNTTNSKQFSDILEKSLNEMFDLCKECTRKVIFRKSKG